MLGSFYIGLTAIVGHWLSCLRPIPLHRDPPTAPARGLFRVDGFGAEYSRRICWGDLDGVEEGGGGEKSWTLTPSSPE